jgi:hypothetical protein
VGESAEKLTTGPGIGKGGVSVAAGAGAVGVGSARVGDATGVAVAVMGGAEVADGTAVQPSAETSMTPRTSSG